MFVVQMSPPVVTIPPVTFLSPPNHHHQTRPALDLKTTVIDKYAYFLCIHVKPTTIFIALFILIRSLLIASMLLYTEFAIYDHNQQLSLVGSEDLRNSATTLIGILSRIIMAFISAVGINAVVSRRSVLLIPLFAMLISEFILSVPLFFGREIFLLSSYDFTHLRCQRYTLILHFIAMIVKIFSLRVVWKCYRLLRLSEIELRIDQIFLSGRDPHLFDGIVGMNHQQSETIAAQSVALPTFYPAKLYTEPANCEQVMSLPNFSTIHGQPVDEPDCI